jgi:hypothetical protein
MVSRGLISQGVGNSCYKLSSWHVVKLKFIFIFEKKGGGMSVTGNGFVAGLGVPNDNEIAQNNG